MGEGERGRKRRERQDEQEGRRGRGEEGRKTEIARWTSQVHLCSVMCNLIIIIIPR